MIEKKINDLILNNNIEKSNSYQNSPEYSETLYKINTLKEQQSNLKRHPLINFRKIRKINVDINNLEESFKQKNELFEIKKKDNITNRELEIELLRSKLQSIEFQLSYIKEEKDNNQQVYTNLNKKVFEYFKCNSIKEVSVKIDEAKEFMKDYDYSNKIILQQIDNELKKISEQILLQETELQNIQEERKIVSI